MKSILLLMCLTWAVLAHEPGLPVISGPTEEVPVTFIPAQPTMPAEQPQMMPEQPQPMPAQPMPEHMPMMPMMPKRPIENPVQCPAIEVQQSVLKVSDALEDGAILHKIKFETPTNTGGIAWVDVHFSINNGQQLNFRMQKVSDKLFEFAPVAMRAGDVLSYKFTYCVMLMTSQGQIDCDTETFTFSVPAHIEAPVAPPAECRDIQWTQALAPTGVTMDGTTLHKFVWTAKTPIAMSGFVDLHYRIGHDTDFVNVRMTKLSETTWEFAGVPVKAGETVEYFYTFCILLPTNQRIDCDTNIMTYTPNARKTQFISKSMQNINAEASSSMSMSSNFAPILEVQPRALTAAELAYLQAYPQAGHITAGLAVDESDGDFSGEEAIANDNDARNERRGRVVFDADGSGIDEDQYAQVAATPAEPVAAATQAARASFARSYSAAPSSLYGVSIEHADL